MNRFSPRMTDLGYSILQPSQRDTGDTAAQIAKYEAAIGASLPPDYKDFLAEFGGATFADTYEAPITEPGHAGDYACPEVFFGFYRPDQGQKARHFDLNASLSAFKSRIPDGFIPIARAIGGNLILLGVAGPQKGTVYYWDHETQEVWLVAKDFTNFMTNLQLAEGDDDDDE